MRATNPLGSGQEGERLLLSASSSLGAVQEGRSDPSVQLGTSSGVWVLLSPHVAEGCRKQGGLNLFYFSLPPSLLGDLSATQ